MIYLEARVCAVSSACALPNAARVCFNWAGVGQGEDGPDAELAASECSNSRPGQASGLVLGSETVGAVPFGRMPSLRS